MPIIQQDGSSSDQSSSSNKGIGSNERSSSSGRGIMSRMSLRRGEKSKHRNSCVNDQQGKSLIIFLEWGTVGDCTERNN